MRNLQKECSGNRIKYHRRGQAIFRIHVGPSVVHHQMIWVVRRIGVVGVIWWNAFHGGIVVHIVICVDVVDVWVRMVDICSVWVVVWVVRRMEVF